jgi:hypothetical protein
MIKIEKELLKSFSKAKVIGHIRTDKLDKVLLTLPQAEEVIVEAWIGKRITFSAVIEGETVRIKPKTGVRYDNLEAWLRGTVGAE